FDGKDCKQPVAGGDSACGTTNGDPNACPGGGGCKPPDFQITPPWPAEFKASGGTTSMMDTPQFLEIGVDLTKFGLDQPNGGAPCFGKFLADTRESSTTTSTIPDYALGSFNTCNTVTTTSASSSSITSGQSIHDNATITGSSLFGSAPPVTGTVNFFVCGPGADPTVGCTTGGTAV